MEECRYATCGLLAVKHKQNRQFLEVEKEKRETWDIKTDHREEIQFQEDIPTCFAGAISFKEQLGASIRKGDILKLLHEDRQCPKYTPWIQGFNPREHKEMVNEVELRKWQDEVRSREIQRQKDQKEDDRRWERSQKWRDRFWGVFVGILLLIIGFLLGKQ